MVLPLSNLITLNGWENTSTSFKNQGRNLFDPVLSQKNRNGRNSGNVS